MSNSHNTSPDEKKPQPGAAGSERPNEQVPDKIVISDECGDTLWEEVLAQQQDLSTLLNKPAGAESDKSTANSHS